MAIIMREPEPRSFHRRQQQFKIGDRVITCNRCLGTVVRLDRDEKGDYIVARLDIMRGEFAYDPWDLKKIE
ncbi:hypothetical protein DOT_4039 [Desulfosporosinus sp. OT]|nr:hypothetical protein DOT_4039 [Desulfosporosinus sp. OT]